MNCSLEIDLVVIVLGFILYIGYDITMLLSFPDHISHLVKCTAEQVLVHYVNMYQSYYYSISEFD